MIKFSSFKILVLLLSFSACCIQAEVVFKAQEVDKGQVVKLPTPASVIGLILFYLEKIIHLFLQQIPTQSMWCAIYCEASGASACPAFTMSPGCQFVNVDASLAALGGATEAVYIMA